MRDKISRREERGAALLELAIGASVFFTAIFGVLECGRLLWTHNALADAARRGARYAVMNTGSETCDLCKTNVRNVVVFGDPAGGGQPVVTGLTTGNVTVAYANFGVKQGSVSVRITGFNFNFAIPLIGGTLAMPEYHTTLTGESAGFIPPNI